MRDRAVAGMSCSLTCLMVIVVLQVDSVIGVPVAQRQAVDALDKTVDIETLSLSTDDRFRMVYSDMITALQRLAILPPPQNSSLCMGLDRAQRQVKIDDSSGSLKQVAVVLYFKEASLQDVTSARTTGQVVPICKYSSDRGGIYGGLSSDSLREGGENETKPKPNTNVTNALGGGGVGDAGGAEDPKTKGLSKTQVAVIVTCAVVLGSFFIIAGILRIRSCLKRYRISREAAMSVARRTSNIGLNGSNFTAAAGPGGGLVRLDSSSSKASRQSDAGVKSGRDLQINTSNRPPLSVPPDPSPLHNQDHQPLLPVRSLTQGPESGSVHGSLTYIDEEAHSKGKDEQVEDSDSELDSEDDPLLRKSPDSGSSIEVTMADVYNTENVELEPLKGPEEQQRKSMLNDIEETVDETDGLRTGGCNNKEATDLVAIDENTQVNANGDGQANGDGYRPDIDLEADNELTRRVSLLPRHQYSIDSYAFDFSECDFGNGIFDWPKDDLDEEETSPDIMNSYAVTIGLNQSDSSISENPSYRYGNQSEYVYDTGYCSSAYRSPYEPIFYDNYRYTDTCDSDDTETTGNNDESSDNVNGLGVEEAITNTDNISPSDISSGSLSMSKDSSGEPLLSHNHQHLRMPSNGTNRITGADNLALVDSGEEEPCTGNNSSPCTVVSQIVPLAVYHRNSMC